MISLTVTDPMIYGLLTYIIIICYQFKEANIIGLNQEGCTGDSSRFFKDPDCIPKYVRYILLERGFTRKPIWVSEDPQT